MQGRSAAPLRNTGLERILQHSISLQWSGCSADGPSCFCHSLACSRIIIPATASLRSSARSHHTTAAQRAGDAEWKSGLMLCELEKQLHSFLIFLVQTDCTCVCFHLLNYIIILQPCSGSMLFSSCIVWLQPDMDFILLCFSFSAWCVLDRISSSLFVRRELVQVIQAQVFFFIFSDRKEGTAGNSAGLNKSCGVTIRKHYFKVSPAPVNYMLRHTCGSGLTLH